MSFVVKMSTLGSGKPKADTILKSVSRTRTDVFCDSRQSQLAHMVDKIPISIEYYSRKFSTKRRTRTSGKTNCKSCRHEDHDSAIMSFLTEICDLHRGYPCCEDHLDVLFIVDVAYVKTQHRSAKLVI